MIYFTSDLHFGHENAIDFTSRPFTGVEHMNDTLINNINERVGANDELWILGDFSFKITIEQARNLRSRINCKNVNLVYGNHDKDYTNTKVFQSVQHYKELKTKYGKIILFHYPILEWNCAHHGSIHLHGHIHSTGEYNKSNRLLYLKDRIPNGHAPNKDLQLRIYDVGVDANDYRPISLDEIFEYFNIIDKDM